MSPEMLFRAPRPYPRRHRSAFFMAVFFIAIVAGGYVLFRSSAIFAGPALSLEEPVDGALLHSATLAIKGRTEPKTRLTINGYEVFSDDTGAFKADLPAQRGFHLLDVRVKNRVGRESRIVRRIVVE